MWDLAHRKRPSAAITARQRALQARLAADEAEAASQDQGIDDMDEANADTAASKSARSLDTFGGPSTLSTRSEPLHLTCDRWIQPPWVANGRS